MDHKNIKLAVRKQLKKQFPAWKRLSRKVKKELARNVLVEAWKSDKAHTLSQKNNPTSTV